MFILAILDLVDYSGMKIEQPTRARRDDVNEKYRKPSPGMFVLVRGITLLKRIRPAFLFAAVIKM